MSTSSIGDRTVTIDRAHFETILRRANLTADDIDSPTVSVSQSDYAGLKLIATKYTNLRQNLLRGGVGEETIDLLSHDDATIEQEVPPATNPIPAEVNDCGFTFEPPMDVYPRAPRGGSRSYGGHNLRSKSHNHHQRHGDHHLIHTPEVPDWAEADADEDDSTGDAGHLGNPDNQGFAEAAGSNHVNSRPFYERQCARSVLLSNLAEGTTHADITRAIRGGQLIDIYLRPHDRTAAVSFLLSADARGFLDHVRRHDLYIKQKRVDVRWNDRQFILPGHVASKIGTGATRNLVIRRCDPRLTEAALREDLDHIHNLIIVKVDFVGGSCYIKTNSVHNAMFARTCMMSRLRYKHSKIEWDVDECAQPFEESCQVKTRKEAVNTKRRSGNMANRFHLLNLEDDGDEESLAASSPFRPKSTMGIVA
ncbi:hypothetical protein N0V93_005041 [Gnomoniopsis smithogilvyi]|uniref:RNA-binding protein n=1 Tax=Gnomoniopsis smithogilvyi TaxID=1191159 RepID=A0A9W8YVY2_9PEZI|nr:hypothetical protein N0V93_005041 [Gnomoniopsis smithogilvyi]